MATCYSKQEVILLHQISGAKSQIAYCLVTLVTLQCLANFLHFLQSKNIGSPNLGNESFETDLCLIMLISGKDYLDFLFSTTEFPHQRTL